MYSKLRITITYYALIDFIKEEQRHARDLGKFMRLQEIPLIHSHWVDNVFRKLRRHAGLELSVIVLITAEIIAKIFYKALEKSTKSIILTDICKQILNDEKMHIQFQSETLHKLAQNRSVIVNNISRQVHRFLFEGTLIVVWFQHKSVFKTGGYTLKSFYHECRQEFKFSNMIIVNS